MPRREGLPTLAEAFEEFISVNPNARQVRVHRQGVPEEPETESVGLGEPSIERDLQAGRGETVYPNYRTTGLGGGEPDDEDAAVRLPPPLRGLRRIEEPGGPVACSRGEVSPAQEKTDFIALGSIATLVSRYRVRENVRRLPGHLSGSGSTLGCVLGEIKSLRWERVDLDRRILRVDETKTGEVLELPVTRQLGEIFERRYREAGGMESGGSLAGWVFPSQKSASGHVEDVYKFYAAIGKAGGTKFWFHGLRNSFITVAERELLLPRSLTKRLVNHSRGTDVTEGYAADWTAEQLREPAQRVADRIDALRHTAEPGEYACANLT